MSTNVLDTNNKPDGSEWGVYKYNGILYSYNTCNYFNMKIRKVISLQGFCHSNIEEGRPLGQTHPPYVHSE